MKVFPLVSGQCDCGSWMVIFGDGIQPNVNQWLECPNVECANYRKKFKLPTIELEEIQ